MKLSGARCGAALLLTAAIALMGGCTGLPHGVDPVRDFQLDRYLGTWYEIARLDHGFERGLSRVTATYTRREDGGVRVVNRGYDAGEERWEEAVGKAYFVAESNVGRLKVSFFGPFYGGYNVIVLDPHYQYAMVAGPTRDYLWILAREPDLDEEALAQLVDQARALGFPTDELIDVAHRQPPG